MRVEDLDAPRVRPGAADAILRDHEWLGLDWDEGPIFQSAQNERYAAALEALTHMHRVYPCTCSRREIALVATAPHGDTGPVYPGTCRQGPSHPERTAAIRFRMPEPTPTVYDRVRGMYDAPRPPGDFVIRRADGQWSYQFAVVVDDAEMGITEVIRGDDLLSSTPWQLALYEALAVPAPSFAHVPLVLGPDGKRLAKRAGAPPISALRDAGWPPAQVWELLAGSLGLPHCRTLDEMIDHFSLETMPRAPYLHATATEPGASD